MTEPVRITIPGKPLSVNAAKRAVIVRGRSMSLKSREARDFEARAQLAARKAMGRRPMLTGDLEIRVVAFWSRRGADSDACLKPTRDALEGIVYAKDSIIRSDHTDRQVDPENPRVEVCVYAYGHPPRDLCNSWEDAHEGTGEPRRTLDDPTAGRAYLNGAAP